MRTKRFAIGCGMALLVGIIGCSMEVTDEGDLAIVGPDETFENLEN